MGIVFAILNFILGLLGYAKKANQPSAEERAGRAEVTAEIQQRAANDVSTAVEAARVARDIADRNPGSLRDPDPYSRT